MALSEETEADLNAAIEKSFEVAEAQEANDKGESNDENAEREVDDSAAMGDGSEGAPNSGEGNIKLGEVDAGDDGGKEVGGESEAAQVRADAEAAAAESDAAVAVLHRVVLSDSIVAAAVNAGIPASVALSMESDGQLEDLVRSVMGARPQAEGEEKEEVDPFAGLEKLDPEVYGKEAIAMFDKFRDVFKAQQEQLDELRTSQGDMALVSAAAAESAQSGAAKEVGDWFDEKISGLGEDFTEALGTGGYGALDRGSSQFAKRDAVAQSMAVTLAGYKASGMEAPPRDEVFQAAVRVVLGDDIVKNEETKLSEKLSKRGTQHISRANGQQSTNTDSAEVEVARELDEKYFKG